MLSKHAILNSKDSIGFCAAVSIINKNPFSLLMMREFCSHWIPDMADEPTVCFSRTDVSFGSMWVYSIRRWLGQVNTLRMMAMGLLRC